MFALSQSSSQITSFEIDTWRTRYENPGVPPTVFDTNVYSIRDKRKHLDIELAAFSRLKKFVLRIAHVAEEPNECESTPELFGNIDGIPALLRSMDQLKHLSYEFLWTYRIHLFSMRCTNFCQQE